MFKNITIVKFRQAFIKVQAHENFFTIISSSYHYIKNPEHEDDLTELTNHPGHQEVFLYQAQKQSFDLIFQNSFE